MDAYESLLKAIHDRAFEDAARFEIERSGGGGTLKPSSGQTAAQLTAQAIAMLPALHADGELSAERVHAFDRMVGRPDAPFYIRDMVSEVNLAAAQELGDLQLSRKAALTRCGVLRDMMAVNAPPNDDAERRQFRRCSRTAIDIAVEWDLEQVDPNLVGDLRGTAATYG